MTGGRWIDAFPQAQARLGLVVRSGALGADVRFLALRSAPQFTGSGVIEELADASLAILSGVFGKLELLECAHDGRGGPEAEARLEFGNAQASGTLVLSRLRSLGDRVEIVGKAGRVSLDAKSGRLTAEPAELLHTIEPTTRGRVSPVEALASVISVRGDARELRHPWEVKSGRAFPEVAGKRVLVTGSTGFIGARVVERLAESGAHVTAALRNKVRSARIARLGVELVVMREGDEIRQLVRGHDAVVNLAHDFSATPRRNEGISLAIADACEAEGVPLLVQASSIAVYDSWPGAPLDEQSPSDAPGHAYKQLKRAIELELLERQQTGRLRSVILQPTIVYGAFSRQWTDRFAEHFAIGDVAVPGDSLCDGVHVDDVADAVLAAIGRQDAAGRYIVSGPEPFAWREMLALFPQACGEWGRLSEEAMPAFATPELRGNGVGGKPGFLAHLRQRVTALTGAFVRRRFGEERVTQLRAILMRAAARGGRPVFRVAAENPRLFANRNAVSTTRMRRELVEPVIDSKQGTELLHAYLAWRYCPFAKWPDISVG